MNYAQQMLVPLGGQAWDLAWQIAEGTRDIDDAKDVALELLNRRNVENKDSYEISDYSFREKNGIFTLGFALETEDAIENGRDKMERKGMQLVAVNVANEPGAGFEVETNRISLVHSSGKVEELPLATKEELADQLLDHIESAMDE